ncbi:MAG: AzlD domain-containing protein [Clostridia bacterium]|nr:AzlD domain-containing protein [Clostridia bacterium]
MPDRFFLYHILMAGVTYLIRMLPLTLFRRKIESRLIRSFLFYIPYAVLAAMTIPAIFYATDSVLAAVIGLAVACVLAWLEKGLLTVAISSCITVFIVERILAFLG